MPQFTQLNLNTESTQSAKDIPIRESTQRNTKTAMFAGLIALAIVSGSALLILNGCSKKEAVKTEAISATQPNISPSTTSAVTPSLPAAETQAPKPVKKPKKSPSVTYVNRTYGLSLQYPRKYSLKTGDEAQLEINGSPMPMDFAKSGGVTVAALEMPRGMYPGTDLNQAFLMVNVNRNLSAGECELQLSQTNSTEMKPVPEVKPEEVKPISEEGKSVSAEKEGKLVPESKLSESSPEKVKIGGKEFTQEEKDRTEANSQSETRYYHVFENGSCYEFAMGLSSKPGDSENETKPVDRDAVFAKLEKILATVKIKPPVAPAESSKQVVGDSKCGTEIGVSSAESVRDSGCDSKPLGNSPVVQPTNSNSSSAQTIEPVPQKFEPTPVHPER